METVKIVMSIIYCTKYESIVPFPITSEFEFERKLPNCVFKLGVHPSGCNVFPQADKPTQSRPHQYRPHLHIIKGSSFHNIYYIRVYII